MVEGLRFAGETRQRDEVEEVLDFELRHCQTYPANGVDRLSLDAIAAGIHEVATGEVANVEKLQNCDLRRLLGSASRLLAELPLPKFGDVTVTTVNSNANSATLSYREANDVEAKQVEFVKIEGKWLPKSIVSGWSAAIDDIKARISKLPDQIATFKPVVMQHFDSIDDSLTKLQKATTSEEFSVAVQPLSYSILSAVQFARLAMLEASASSQAGNAVRIEVNRELNDDEQTRLKDAVLANLDGIAIDYEMTSTDGKTRCRFTAIPDPDALVGKLEKHFDGANVRLNSETKTIYVELK